MKRARKLCKLVWSLSHKSGKNDNAVFSGSDHQFLFLYPYEAAKQSHISYILLLPNHEDFADAENVI